ncbi:MAG: hypothetical protein GF341_04785 [candidate division Zixibacteria bacterium]|nr:hypothetical protein [candidate division Zixibacteria bacterium]
MGEVAFLPVSQMQPVLVSVLIFCARIADVAIGTMRIIVVGRGMRWTASLLGFVEVLIWLVAIGMVIQNLHTWVNVLIYCAGFATGTFVGMTIERRFEMGQVMVRIVVPHLGEELVDRMSELSISPTHVDAKSPEGPVRLIYLVVKRKMLRKVVHAIHTQEPGAWYSVEDVRDAGEEPVPIRVLLRSPTMLQPFYWFRKGK